jgi:hypothetical protein
VFRRLAGIFACNIYRLRNQGLLREPVIDTIPLRSVIVVQPIHVQLQGAIVAPQSSEKDRSGFEEVYPRRASVSR